MPFSNGNNFLKRHQIFAIILHFTIYINKVKIAEMII